MNPPKEVLQTTFSPKKNIHRSINLTHICNTYVAVVYSGKSKAFRLYMQSCSGHYPPPPPHGDAPARKHGSSTTCRTLECCPWMHGKGRSGEVLLAASLWRKETARTTTVLLLVGPSQWYNCSYSCPPAIETLPETVFLNFSGAQQSIPRNRFHQTSLCSLAGWYDNPILT